jgi:hypothetical protein
MHGAWLLLSAEHHLGGFLVLREGIDHAHVIDGQKHSAMPYLSECPCLLLPLQDVAKVDLKFLREVVQYAR